MEKTDITGFTRKEYKTSGNTFIGERIALFKEKIGVSIDKLADEIRQIAENVAQNPKVTFRLKDSWTLSQKMKLEQIGGIFLIDDVYGIRVIVESTEEAYKVLEKIALKFPGHIDHDYIKEPKMCVGKVNQGKMLRLLQFIAYKNKVPFEIQITTTAFHEMNETLHEEYKKTK